MRVSTPVQDHEKDEDRDGPPPTCFGRATIGCLAHLRNLHISEVIHSAIFNELL